MVQNINDLNSSIEHLTNAIELYSKADNNEKDLYFLMLAKAFEILVEYSWKQFKEKVEGEGLEAPSPKEAVRQAAVIGLIDNPKEWIEFINIRNLSVHDYFGITQEDFLDRSKKLLATGKAING